MPWGYAAVAVGTLGAAAIASDSQDDASDVQQQSAQLGIDEQRRQFDSVRAILDPYVKAGGVSLNSQLDLLGLNGAGPQGTAISGLEKSPMFDALAKQGENGILQNASATGGLRGGNTQAALAQFRPGLLSALIDQQYSRLGGITSLGQNAAAGVGNAGMQTGNAVTALLQQQGAAAAGGILANGRTQASTVGSLGGLVGGYYGLRGQPGTGFDSPGYGYDPSNYEGAAAGGSF